MSKRTKKKTRERDCKEEEENQRSLTLDDLFEILGNPHRREIIKLLSQEERYAFELAKLLNISQRAVTKHLESLSRLHLVSTKEVPSNQGPQRRYYALDSGWLLSVSIGPKVFQTIIREIGAEPSEEEIKKITEQVRRGRTIDLLWNSMREFQAIENEIHRLEERKIELLQKRTSLAEAIDRAFERMGFTDVQRDILRVLIERGGTLYLTELIELLQDPPEEIREALGQLQEQEIVLITWISPNEGRVAIQEP